MKNLLFLFPILTLFSCSQQAEQHEAIQSTDKSGWTKPLITSVDAPTTYYDDVNDDDFSDCSKLIAEIFDEVYAGKLQPYHFIDGAPLTIDEVKKSAVQVDTMYVEDPNPPFELQMKIVVTDLTNDIISLKLKETWRFNKETLQLEKKVLGAAPRVAVYNMQTGELRGYTPLFWVFFDKEAEENFKKKANS